MYKEHNAWPALPDDLRIWRYMDFAKFVALLDGRVLHFARADQLGDQFEGSYSAGSVRQFDSISGGSITQAQIEQARALRQRAWVNCWQAIEHESSAMWGAYTSGAFGVAIQSTVARLKLAIAADPNGTYILPIQGYIDYRSDTIPIGNWMRPFLYKRKIFDHEREVRALVLQSADDVPRGPDAIGIKIAVNPGILIERVRIAPESPSWFKEVVESISLRWDVDAPIGASELDEVPLF